MGSHLYLARVNNRFFGYTNEELRTAMKLENNSGCIWPTLPCSCLLAQFYNSDDQTLTSGSFFLEELKRYDRPCRGNLAAASGEQVEA